jgi:uncharacterized protein YbaP (TraB family)
MERALRILRALVAPRREIDKPADRSARRMRLVSSSFLSSFRFPFSWARGALPALVGACCALAGVAAQAACPPSAIGSLERSRSSSDQRSGADRGLLWRIEKDGRTSWLYGTIHLGRAPWLRPGPTVQRALGQSDALALEIDVRDPAAMKPLTQPADPALVARLLSGERARRLARQNEIACVTPGANAALQPILQVTALTGLAGRADGLYPDFGIDEMLAVWARNANKPVFALENPAAQLEMLTGGSEEEEAAQIDSALDELESGQLRAQLKELADAWGRSDLARLARYPEWCDCMRTPAEQRLMTRLLDDRNPILAAGIARMHDGGQRVFAAVGALHMIGAQGLPTLLAAQGFTVTEVLPGERGTLPAAAEEPEAEAAAAPPVRSARGSRSAKAAPVRGKAGARAAAPAKGTKAAPKGAKPAAKAPAKSAAKPAAKAPAKPAASKTRR